MYIQGLIPRNSTELAEVVPNARRLDYEDVQGPSMHFISIKCVRYNEGYFEKYYLESKENCKQIPWSCGY